MAGDTPTTGTPAPEPDKPRGRDGKGRFTRGNPGGPGGPRKRAYTLQENAAAAITEEHLQAMLRKAAAMALQGNLSAMRFVFERVCGKPRETPADTEPLGITLPPMRTAAECVQAVEVLVTGICDGKVERDMAKLLIDAVQARLRSLEVHELEQRLADLEEAAARVEMPQHGGRRT